MSHRRFSDRSGQRWEVRIRARGDWEFRPVSGNRSPPHHGEPPHHATDPFELSEPELWSVLEDATSAEPEAGERRLSRDDRVPGGLFDWKPPEKKSPFIDDRKDG